MEEIEGKGESCVVKRDIDAKTASNSASKCITASSVYNVGGCLGVCVNICLFERARARVCVCVRERERERERDRTKKNI